MKIITFYLPQFHQIPENDKMWGEGFTEWVNVKKAKPLYNGHEQPVVPLNKNYYNLLDIKVMRWQAELAKKYGVYGFCFYHYWIEGRKLLEKPVEQFLKTKDVDINFCLSWANHSWTDSWTNEKPTELITQTYGKEEDWKSHFEYLEPFFNDSRYIRVDGKPLFIIYMPEDIPNLNEMLDCWQKMAVDRGYAGISFAYQYIYFDMNRHKDDSRFDYGIEFQPAYAIADSRGKAQAVFRKNVYQVLSVLQKKMHINVNINKKTNFEKKYYATIWKYVLSRQPDNMKKIPGAFSKWDNTPRKGNRGLVLDGASPQLFGKYMSDQIKRARQVYKKDMIFFTAWNEWAEGCVLEPDEKDGFGYLEELRKALLENDEFPF